MSFIVHYFGWQAAKGLAPRLSAGQSRRKLFLDYRSDFWGHILHFITAAILDWTRGEEYSFRILSRAKGVQGPRTLEAEYQCNRTFLVGLHDPDFVVGESPGVSNIAVADKQLAKLCLRNPSVRKCRN